MILHKTRVKVCSHFKQNAIIQLIIPGVQSMTYTRKKKRLFLNTWKQNKAQEKKAIGSLPFALQPFLVLCICITQSTKRFSSLIWHPGYKTSLQEKVVSDFWVPRWHKKMAPVIPMIDITGSKVEVCKEVLLILQCSWVPETRFLKHCGSKLHSKCYIHNLVEKEGVGKNIQNTTLTFSGDTGCSGS